jgi:broad specificity phosphatase PhoE
MSSIKRSKFQRSGGKVKTPHVAAKPLEVPAAPPSPEDSAAMAASGADLNRGASNLLPMTDEGREQISKVGEQLADKGGVDSITAAPDDVRGQDTANLIAQADPEPPAVSSDPNLQSWSQGGAEGQPQKQVKAQIQDLIRKNPSQTIPGQGAMSNRPGESFDDFRTRGLSAIRSMMQQLSEQPTAKLGAGTHSQVLKLTKAWLAKNTPDDLSIDPAAMEEDGGDPATVERLHPDENGQWKMEPVDLNDKSPLPQGSIYLVRHGLTPWNKETYEKNNGAQDATAQIAKYGPPLDFGRIRSVAQKAQYDGHMNDDQISNAIDSALPPASAAQDFPLHHLIAVASAASPAKRAEYMPLIQSRMQAEGPPDAKAAIMRHLQMIGGMPPQGPPQNRVPS